MDQGALLGISANSLGTNSIIVGTNGLTAAVETLYDINNPDGSLILGANGEMLLHQNDHFASVNINGTALANGTYSFDALKRHLSGKLPGHMDGCKMVPVSRRVRDKSSWAAVLASSPHIITGIVASAAPTLSISATNGAAGGAVDAVTNYRPHAAFEPMVDQFVWRF